MIGPLVERATLLGQIEASNKDAVLKELLAAAQVASAFPPEVYTLLQKRLAERESIGSTGLGNGVAVPHVKGDAVKEVTLVLARSRAGLEWQAIDGRPVHIVFLLVSPASEPETHLRCLRWISTLARNTDFRRFLLDAADPASMRDLLRELSPKDGK